MICCEEELEELSLQNSLIFQSPELFPSLRLDLRRETIDTALLATLFSPVIGKGSYPWDIQLLRRILFFERLEVQNYLYLAETPDSATEKSMYPLQSSVSFVSLQLVRCRPDKELGRSLPFQNGK